MKDLWPLGLLLLAGIAWGSASTDDDDGGKPKGGGRYWAPRRSKPAFNDFDFGSNKLWISNDCTVVAEGRHFFPGDWATTNTRAEEASTLSATLDLGPDNTVMGFIDYLVDQEGIEDPLVVAARILEEASPQCASVTDDTWGEAMRAWYDSLVRRVTAYMTQETIG